VLFRRDAGTLQAYLVDAETAESHDARLAPTLRCQDLEIMEENLTGELQDLEVTGLLRDRGPISTTGTYICQRYQHLWDEITREEILIQKEHYRIQERIRALNKLGFSIGDIELRSNANGESLHLRVIVTDRYFHRDQLYKLTGLEAEEMQAQKLMNEIHEVKATMSQMNNRSISLSVAAQHWLLDIYQPTVSTLDVLKDRETALAELYCQVLEHKWYLSERAHQDVGHITAVEDFILWSKLDKFTS
jgi:DNA-binding transcriptional MerR regulator